MRGNHTPEPWIVEIEHDTFDSARTVMRVIDGSERSMSHPQGPVTIATINVAAHAPHLEEPEANTFLIGSAPKLLAALVRIVDYHVPRVNPLSDAAILSGRAAIAEARGGGGDASKALSRTGSSGESSACCQNTAVDKSVGSPIMASVKMAEIPTTSGVVIAAHHIAYATGKGIAIASIEDVLFHFEVSDEEDLSGDEKELIRICSLAKEQGFNDVYLVC